MNTEISPTPTDEEAAAVIAAAHALWPRPVADDSADNPRREPAWRFSARWWARPVAARRARPYH